MEKHKKTNKRKSNKTEVITLRVTNSEKKKLKSKAFEWGQNLSEYLLSVGLESKSCRLDKNNKEVYYITMLQELCNYVEEKYGEDEFFDEWGDKLWDSL